MDSEYYCVGIDSTTILKVYVYYFSIVSKTKHLYINLINLIFDYGKTHT